MSREVIAYRYEFQPTLAQRQALLYCAFAETARKRCVPSTQWRFDYLVDSTLKTAEQRTYFMLFNTVVSLDIQSLPSAWPTAVYVESDFDGRYSLIIEVPSYDEIPF